MLIIPKGAFTLRPRSTARAATYAVHNFFLLFNVYVGAVINDNSYVIFPIKLKKNKNNEEEILFFK